MRRETLPRRGCDDFIFAVPCDLADDFWQVMREVSKVKICERVAPGFVTYLGFLHRTVTCDAEVFVSTRCLRHALVMAEAFGFGGKETARQNEMTCHGGSRSETVGISKYCSSVGTALYVGQDRMWNEVRGGTDVNWAGRIRLTSSRWIYFGRHLLETYSSTKIVTLSIAESECISITMGA